MVIRKRHETIDTTNFSRANLLRTFYGFATGRGATRKLL